MQESELLVTTAQVAIGLAGFSGVAGVLGERRGPVGPAVQGALLRAMIEISLLAAAFSLLPIVLSHAHLGAEALWRLSAGINLAAFATQFGFMVRRATRIIRSGGQGFPRPWGVFVFTLAAFVVASLAASALGFSSASLYISALFAQLVFSGASFVRFIAFLTS